jgi:hypothetical protein
MIDGQGPLPVAACSHVSIVPLSANMAILRLVLPRDPEGARAHGWRCDDQSKWMTDVNEDHTVCVSIYIYIYIYIHTYTYIYIHTHARAHTQTY